MCACSSGRSPCWSGRGGGRVEHTNAIAAAAASGVEVQIDGFVARSITLGTTKQQQQKQMHVSMCLLGSGIYVV